MLPEEVALATFPTCSRSRPCPRFWLTRVGTASSRPSACTWSRSATATDRQRIQRHEVERGGRLGASGGRAACWSEHDNKGEFRGFWSLPKGYGRIMFVETVYFRWLRRFRYIHRLNYRPLAWSSPDGLCLVLTRESGTTCKELGSVAPAHRASSRLRKELPRSVTHGCPRSRWPAGCTSSIKEAGPA